MITQEQLRERLSYDPDTGVFTWLRRPENSRDDKRWNTSFAGTIAGRTNGKGYRQIGIGDRRYHAHRLAWLYVHGIWPSDHVDHIDGNKLNNAIANLREATHTQNQYNCGRRRDNASGHKGVCWHRQRCKWQAQIRVNRRHIHLGLYDCPDAAAAAYAAAAKRLHGEFANTGKAAE